MRSPIFINKNPAGKWWNMLFGVGELMDGVIRVLSFGWLSSTSLVEITKRQGFAMIKVVKKKRKENELNEKGDV